MFYSFCNALLQGTDAPPSMSRQGAITIMIVDGLPCSDRGTAMIAGRGWASCAMRETLSLHFSYVPINRRH
jgi:hypothetical protein